MTQDWLYDEGDDATKAVYVSKMDEIRFIAGPIVQRYMDKVEAERQAVQKVEEEKAAKKKEEMEAKKKAEEEAKKAAEPKKSEKEDEDMKDADVLRPDAVEEPSEGDKK